MQQQSKLIAGIEPTTQDTRVEKFIKNPVALLFFYDIQIVSFLIANIGIIIILNHYFQLDFTIYILTVVFGIFFSLVIIKTYYFLDLPSAKERIINFIRDLIKRPQFRDIERPSVNIFEIAGFALRNLFFNLLNDSFIVLIYWMFVFTILIWLHITKIPDPFTDFAEAISSIGIVSGLFQIYIKDYKEKSSDLIKSIIEEKMSILSTISLKDFEIFLIQKNKDQFVKAIQNIIKQKDVLSQETIDSYKSLGRERYILSIHNIHVPRIIDSNSINGFIEFEMHLGRDNSFNIKELHFQYQDYLEMKRTAFKSKITEKNIAELRKILFSMIIFSDEITTSLMRFSTGMPKKLESPTTFIEFYSNFQRECINDLLYLILSNKPNNPR